MLHEQLGGKPAHPAEELPQPPAPDELKVPLDQQPGHHLCVAGSGGVLDRLLHEPVCATPGGRTAAQLARGLAPELELQNLAEQMVVAIPLPARVERDQEHVRVREVGEHRNRVLAPENRVAQLGCEAPKHRRAHEEVLDVRRERGQNLVCQIVADVAGAARELPHAPVRGPEDREATAPPDTGPPAIPPCDRRATRRSRWIRSIPSRPTSSRVSSTVNASSRARTSVSRPRARRRARPIAGSKRVETTRRAFARQPLDRVAERAHRNVAADGVQVVEHDRHPTAIRDQAIHQLIDRSLNRRAPYPEARQRATSEALPEPLDRCRQVRPQPHRVVIGRVERDPDHRLGTLDTPRTHQRRLAVTHRRVQHRERGPGVIIEHLEQARPAQRPRVNPRRHQLWLDHPKTRAIHLRCR